MENNIHLNLKSKWFDLILLGEKEQEYREIKAYFIHLFIDKTNFKNWGDNDFIRELEYHKLEILQLKNIKTITFLNGYAKNRRQILVELEKITIGKGKEEWGAEWNKEYFILHLGSIISHKNCYYSFFLQNKNFKFAK